MRLLAKAPPGEAGISWLMIYEDDAGVYLFGSSRATDGGEWDEWYATVAEARESAEDAYGIPVAAWNQIADPLEHCPHDWIQPVRMKGRDLGQPEWGKLERLVDGNWLEFNPETDVTIIPMTPNLLQLSYSVADLCRQAGAFIREQVMGFDQSKIESKGLHDMVSYVDKESEKRLVAGLQTLLPTAGFVTEEGTVANSNASVEYRWIIDPLDGTTNFIHGLPCFAVSVALARGNEPVLGVVYEVSRDECFRGAQGHGAFLNDQPIHVSQATRMDDTLIATGLPFYKFDHLDAYLRILTEYMQHSRGLRRWGSAATDLAYVACGRFDSYFEFNINSYDVAAGILLVREAGGRVTQWLEAGDPVFNREVLATNGHVHDEMQTVMRQHWQPGFQW